MLKLPFLKKNTYKPSKFLTLELNSCEIKCLAFYKEKSELKIIGSGSVLAEPGFIRNGIIADMDAVVGSTQEAVEKATEEIEDEVKDVIISITSDLCVDTLTTAKITRGNADPLSQNELDNFREKIIESASAEVHKRYAENTGDSETELELVTSSIVYTKVDDQKVEDIIGRNAHTLEIALYTAFSPEFHVVALKKFAKKLGLNLLAISPESFAIQKALKNTDVEHSDFSLMQINGDFTSVSIVFGGTVVTSKSLPVGKKHFVDEVARIMGITIPEATKMLDSHAGSTLNQSESELVKDCLEDITELWLEGVALLFMDFSGVKLFPEQFHIYGSASNIGEIIYNLKERPWTKPIPFKAPPEFRILELKDLNKITDATGRTNDNKWVGVAALSYIFEDLI